MKLWCQDCRAVRIVNRHGFCEVCGSSALCDPAPVPLNLDLPEGRKRQIRELERMLND